MMYLHLVLLGTRCVLSSMPLWEAIPEDLIRHTALAPHHSVTATRAPP